MINHKATREKCKILNLAAVAREFHITRSAVSQIIDGSYKTMQSPNAVAVLNLVRSLNLLVETESIDQEK